MSKAKKINTKQANIRLSKAERRLLDDMRYRLGWSNRRVVVMGLIALVNSSPVLADLCGDTKNIHP